MLLDKIPVRKRMYVMLALLVITVFFLVSFIRSTTDIYSRVETLRAKTAIIQNADRELKLHRDMLRNLDERAGKLQRQQVEIESHVQFLEYMENLCKKHKLRLIRLPQEEIHQMESWQIAVIDFSLEGSYHEVLEMIYQIEHLDRVATVDRCHLHKEEVREREVRRDMLVSDLRVNRMLPASQELKPLTSNQE